MQKNAQEFLKNLARRQISGLYCETRQQAIEAVVQRIPASATVAFSGSLTLHQLGIISLLESKGLQVYNHTKPGLSRQEAMQLRHQGVQADFYLTSANALSRDGKMVFFSAWGHRIAAIADARQVIVVCGINKLTGSLDEALKRARELVTPLNCKRLNWKTPCSDGGLCRQEDCFAPEYARMCCQILVVEADMLPSRMTVILVGESLGF
ncbi:MAG TPA: lactate utilization protein [Candidatus Omnitrophota bacterium]|nr:lactate utilization protein [Candidatus Omnitrophota bacterium]HRZ15474.1 lactate utilization protein [Candidatus Omnitrophota bacterium]